MKFTVNGIAWRIESGGWLYHVRSLAIHLDSIRYSKNWRKKIKAHSFAAHIQLKRCGERDNKGQNSLAYMICYHCHQNNEIGFINVSNNKFNQKQKKNETRDFKFVQALNWFFQCENTNVTVINANNLLLQQVTWSITVKVANKIPIIT